MVDPVRLEDPGRHPAVTDDCSVGFDQLKRKAMNRLFATPLAPSGARPYVVAGTKGVTFSRRWYVDITEVTRSVAIAGEKIEECVAK
jgi:hypothetical protein